MSFSFKLFRRYMLTLSRSVRRQREFSGTDRELLVRRVTKVVRRPCKLIGSGSRIAFKLAWKPFERQFGGQIERFRQHRKNVEKEAGLAHMIEAADSRAVVLRNQMQLETNRQGQYIYYFGTIYGLLIVAVNERLRLLEALSTVDYAAKHQKVQRARYEGTGGWLLKHETYRIWKDSNDSACLRCSGIRKDLQATQYKGIITMLT